MRQLIVIMLTALLVTACGGGSQRVDFSSTRQASLIYSYPYDGQQEVPTHAPVVLRFSEPLTTQDAAAQVTLANGQGDAVDATARQAEDGRVVVVTPDSALMPDTDYVVTTGDQTSADGTVEVPKDGIHFHTTTALRGATSEVTTDADFRVQRMIPDGTDLPILDFSPLRIEFTQPIDRDTLGYGDGKSVSLKDADGDPVKADVIAKGRFLTIDPENDLQYGKQYTLVLTNALKSTLGKALIPGGYASRTFTPKRSTPRDTMIQNAAASNPDASQRCGRDTQGDTLSPLTGMPVNCVPLKSTVLGDSTRTQQTGDIGAQLAFPPSYPDATPFRISKGSLLTGSNVDVMIAGAVPAGYSTGPIQVTFVSDAIGYMLPNPYSSDVNAPKLIRLYMDVAMTAVGAKANGGLSQDLLHLQLVGKVTVRDGSMILDAVGVVEPRVLGIDNGYGVVSFHMASYQDQEHAPSPTQDLQPPTVQSWVPGDGDGESARPGDSILVNFNEPVSRASLKKSGAVALSKDNKALDDDQFHYRLDGGTLVIRPDSPLAFGSDYTLRLNSEITDLAGNPLDQDYTLSFSMPEYVAGSDRSPVVISTFPGYGCVTVASSRDLGNDDAGRCAGGKSSDEHVAVGSLPANRPIVVQFSRNMDKSSMQLGGSFKVQRNSQPNGSGQWSEVPGRVIAGRRSLRFHPDTPWEDGALYRYVLGSNGDGQSSSATCDGTDAVCSADGYPLQTEMLAQSPSAVPADTGGGPDMAIYFRGAPRTTDALQTFRNLPTIDVNGNFVYDGRAWSDDESGCTAQSCEAVPADMQNGIVKEENSTKILSTGQGGVVTASNTGCPSGNDCPKKKYVWLTSGLHVEVVGADTFPGTGEQAVRVRVHPNVIYTSNLDVYISVLGGPAMNTPSGPQIMRVRYQKDSNGKLKPLTGWILHTDSGPQFRITVPVYLDAPSLTPPLGLPHNLHSYPATLKLKGPVSFMDDGRMQVQLHNTEAVPINISIGGGTATVDLQIPANGIFLNYMSLPIKE